MAHASTVSSTPWPSVSSPPQRFRDLAPALHVEIASFLHPHEALAAGATEHEMQTLYPAAITHMVIHARPIPEEAPDEESRRFAPSPAAALSELLACRRDEASSSSSSSSSWADYDEFEGESLEEIDCESEWTEHMDRHAASLARLLARLPSLTSLARTPNLDDSFVDRAIFFQKCPQLASMGWTHYSGGHNPASPMLAKAMAKGHLPSWKDLDFGDLGGASYLVEAVEAGHLSRVMTLCLLPSEDLRNPSDLYSVVRAFKTRKEKLEELYVSLRGEDEHDIQGLYHELLFSPACSDLRKLVVDTCEDASSMLFVCDYLKGAGTRGWPSLQALQFDSLKPDDDVSSLADALLPGGGRGTAPNLEEMAFLFLNGDDFEQLGRDLFARGALANITTLKLSNANFCVGNMAALMDGFRHNGGKLKRLIVEDCLLGYPASAKKKSLALIAGLRDGVFPNLEELLMPRTDFLVKEVAQLVKVLKRGAPCARTLRTVVLSRSCDPADKEALQAILPHATVTLG